MTSAPESSGEVSGSPALSGCLCHLASLDSAVPQLCDAGVTLLAVLGSCHNHIQHSPTAFLCGSNIHATPFAVLTGAERAGRGTTGMPTAVRPSLRPRPAPTPSRPGGWAPPKPPAAAHQPQRRASPRGRGNSAQLRAPKVVVLPAGRKQQLFPDVQRQGEAPNPQGTRGTRRVFSSTGKGPSEDKAGPGVGRFH